MNNLQTTPRRASRFAFFAVLVLSCAAPLAALAQAGGPPSAQERAERMKAQTDEIVVALGVSGDMEAKVRGILDKQREERLALMDKYMGSGGRNPENMQKMRTEMQELEKGTREELAAVLSADQLKIYDAKMEEMAQRRGQFGGRRGPGGGPQ